MDLRTGKIYRTKAEALADGVPESDLALYSIEEGNPMVEFVKSFKKHEPQAPTLRFSKGSFKNIRDEQQVP